LLLFALGCYCWHCVVNAHLALLLFLLVFHCSCLFKYSLHPSLCCCLHLALLLLTFYYRFCLLGCCAPLPSCHVQIGAWSTTPGKEKRGRVFF
jgi:hypothetical protein